MPSIIGENELKQFVTDGNIIKNGDVNCAEGLKYDFRLGDRFIKSGFNSTINYEYLLERNVAIIEPGEVVFVLTKEYIDIPMDMNIVLHEKRKLSHEGISLLGGRGVDPGYKGYLFFGLHNISSSTFPLKPGRKLVGATFYRLSETEIVTPSKLPDPWDDFPEDLERFIKQYKPVNPIAISDRLNALQNRVVCDKNELSSKIDKLDGKISDEIKDLGNKITAVDARTKKIDETILGVKVWAKFIAGILGIGIAILTGVLTGFFSKLFGI